MSNKNALLIGGGLAAVAILAMAKGKQIQDGIKYFSYQIRGLKFKMAGLFTPQLIFSIRVVNPNPISIPITSFTGKIKSTSAELATFDNKAAVVIPGNGFADVDVSANIKALTVIMSIIAKQSFSTISVDALLTTQFFSLPIQKTVDLSQISGLESGYTTAAYN